MKTYAQIDQNNIVLNWQVVPELADLPPAQPGEPEPAPPEPPAGWELVAPAQVPALRVGAVILAGVVQPKQIDPRIWWIDVGPFKDRLGIDGLALSASSNAVCVAVKEQLYDRKYVDLKSTQTTQMLGMLMAVAQPAAVPTFPGSGPMTPTKIAAILNNPTTEAERHIKGLQT